MENYHNLSKEEKRAFQLRHVDEWQKSGMCKKEYCRANNLKDSTFNYWVKHSMQQEKRELDLVALSFEQDEASGLSGVPLELVVNGSVTLRIPEGFESGHLVRVLNVLGVAL